MRLTVCLILVSGSMCAQGRDKPHFEAASVKPATPGHTQGTVGGPGTSNPGQITYTDLTLRDLVYQAYGVMPFQLSGPSWMAELRFDIVARLPAGATRAEALQMLQSLLEERFLLKIRRASSEVPAYALTVAKSGPKMQEYPILLPEDFVEAPRITGYDKNGVPTIAPGYSTGMMGAQNGLTTVAIARQPMRSLCQFLSKILQQPVVDQTGLAGRYDARLHFASEQIGPPAVTGTSGLDPAEPEPLGTLPTLVEAVQIQLGLKLEPKKLPVEFLFVEHAERRPTEN